MKKLFKILVILCAFASTTLAQTVTPCGISTPSCQTFVNGDNQNINKTLLSISQTIANSSTIAPTTLTLNTIYNQYQNGKLDSLKQKLDTLDQISRYGLIKNYIDPISQSPYLSDIDTKLSTLNLLLDSLNKPNHLLTYTLNCQSTNTAVAYTIGYNIGNNTLTPVSNFTMSMPNGTYKIIGLWYFNPSGLSCSGINLWAFSNTVTVGNDNAANSLSATDFCDKFLFSALAPSGVYYSPQGTNIFQPMAINLPYAATTTNYAEGNCFTISNNIMSVFLNTTSACTPSSLANYKFVFRLLKIRQ